MELSPLHERLHEVFGDKSFRAIAEMTQTSHETVRRYMNGQSPSVEFLEAVCRGMGVNGQWLLTGRGPKRAEHIRQHALGEANASELLNAMARTLEKLTERVDRLEVFMQTLETRLRAASAPGAAAYSGASPASSGGAGAATGGPVGSGTSHEQRSTTSGAGGDGQARGGAGHTGQAGHAGNPGQAGAADISVRARSIADAVTQRPSSDAR